MKYSIAAAVAVLAIGIGTSADSQPRPEAPSAPAPQVEPYGGCDEAYLYPETAGAKMCEVPHTAAWMTTPCEQEDSTNCYWDAQSFGNNAGHSFYSITVGDEECTIFWEPRYHKKWGSCGRM